MVDMYPKNQEKLVVFVYQKKIVSSLTTTKNGVSTGMINHGY